MYMFHAFLISQTSLYHIAYKIYKKKSVLFLKNFAIELKNESAIATCQFINLFLST